ncbi:hypothetical protein ABGV42_00220 [Paenibacillus pabuli]|uniref:hypothetical protein n=1 Tax=Paenibacillus pabuli TaxID=1472 RepID=UPI0032426508
MGMQFFKILGWIAESIGKTCTVISTTAEGSLEGTGQLTDYGFEDGVAYAYFGSNMLTIEMKDIQEFYCDQTQLRIVSIEQSVLTITHN